MLILTMDRYTVRFVGEVAGISEAVEELQHY
jgi:hypothetical protein